MLSFRCRPILPPHTLASVVGIVALSFANATATAQITNPQNSIGSPETSANSPTTGSIGGTVFDQTSGKPLPGVDILTTLGSEEKKTTTDDSGTFSLPNLKMGRYSLVARKQDYAFVPKIVTLRTGREKAPTSLFMVHSAKVAGKVLDDAGQPLQGIRVTAYEINHRNNRIFLGVGGNGRSDESGAYSISGLLPGRPYVLLASKAQPRHFRRDSVDSSAPALSSGASISREEGIVRTFYPSGARLDAAVRITARPGEDLQNFRITMRRASGFCVTGKVAFTVQRPHFLQLNEITDGFNTPVAFDPIDTESGLSVCNIPPGDYKLSAFTDLTDPSKADFGSLDLRVHDRDVENLSIVAAPVVSVGGEIIWENNIPPQDLTGAGADAPAAGKKGSRVNSGASGNGQVPADANLRFTPANRDRYSGEKSGQLLQVPDSFRISGLLPDTYLVDVLLRRTDVYVKSISFGSHDALREPIDLRASDTLELKITLATDAGGINVVVTGSDRQSVPDTYVTVLPEHVESFPIMLASRWVCQTDGEGICSIGGIPPSKYYAFLTASAIEQTDEARAALWNTKSTAVEVDITASQNQIVQLTPPRGN